MNNENKYYYINKLPKEYHRVIWDIMIIAESDMGLYMTLTKDKAKILMRYLYKITKNSDNWNSLREIIKECYKRYEDSNIELNDTYKYYLNSPLPPRYTMNLGAIELTDYLLDKMSELEGDVKE